MNHFCPDCRAQKIIATNGGPTCTHSEPNGVKWWPVDFAAWSEERRVEWIKKQRTQCGYLGNK